MVTDNAIRCVWGDFQLAALSLAYVHFSNNYAFSANIYYLKLNYKESGTNFKILLIVLTFNLGILGTLL